MTDQMMNHGDMDADQMTHMDMGHPHQPPPAAGNTKPPPPSTFGVHNQMMIGERTIYLSHLPMFMFNPKHQPHNFQVILEVTLTGPGDAQAIYADDRRKNPDVRMYTMSPGAFEMVDFDPQHQKRQSLTGTIFRGHLERGGEPIVEGAVAQVVNIVYFHGFEKDANPLAKLEYLLFGQAPELFLAHVITGPPDFDQLLSVTVNGPSLAADDLRRGIRITVPSRANTPTARINVGDRVTGQAQLGDARAPHPIELELQAGTEWYFEEGELASQFTMDQTPEEKAAGF